jgi:hypothetical protein
MNKKRAAESHQAIADVYHSEVLSGARTEKNFGTKRGNMDHRGDDNLIKAL